MDAVENGNADYKRLYSDDDSLEEKITKIVTEIYGGKSVVFEKKAKNQLKQFAEFGWDKLPVCMAKTQYSFSDNQFLLGAPEGFDITIREFVPKTGAGFIVALTGDVMTMPGLPKPQRPSRWMLLKMEQQLVCSNNEYFFKAVPVGAVFCSIYENLKENKVN